MHSSSGAMRALAVEAGRRQIERPVEGATAQFLRFVPLNAMLKLELAGFKSGNTLAQVAVTARINDSPVARVALSPGQRDGVDRVTLAPFGDFVPLAVGRATGRPVESSRYFGRLTPDQIAFHDALAHHERAADLLGTDNLKAIAAKLVNNGWHQAMR